LVAEEAHNPRKGGSDIMSKMLGVLEAVMLCLVLSFSVTIVMAKQGQPTSEAQQGQEESKTISGTVSSVSDSALTVVDSEQTEHAFVVSGATKVTKAGQDATLADVKTNDTVTVEAKKGADDRWTAVRVSVS
jgi:hypothetical protein